MRRACSGYASSTFQERKRPLETSIRKIIHVDMDAFYASVEQRDDPTLRGRPVVVGGQPNSRGVVAACSYEARHFGVHSAMPCSQAYRLCPHAAFVPPRFSVYQEVSRSIRQIFYDYTEHVEPLALDEAYLDVTELPQGFRYASSVARTIRERIRAELGLVASAGVGPNKFIAKLASDFDKPDGLTVVQPHELLAFISDLPVKNLWGVGPATAKRLDAMNLKTIGEVAATPLVELEQKLGGFGRFIRELATGRDPRPVRSSRPAKSRGAETTFSDNISDKEELHQILRKLAIRVSGALARTERPARTLTLKVRYPDFETVSRSMTLERPTWDAEEIHDVACTLLERTDALERSVRLVGINGSNLYGSQKAAQLELPLKPRPKSESP